MVGFGAANYTAHQVLFRGVPSALAPRIELQSPVFAAMPASAAEGGPREVHHDAEGMTCVPAEFVILQRYRSTT